MVVGEVIPMGYTAHELAQLSGVSVRTLHYYEEQGLLHPTRRDNGYRDYGVEEVQRLQQILLYRRASLPLATIRSILDQGSTAQLAALRTQLDHLRAQHEQLGSLITMVEQLIHETEHPLQPEGISPMNSRDAQRFEALKQQAIQENEATYGAEARTRYGDEAVDASNERIAAMTQNQWNTAQDQAERIGELITQLADAPDRDSALRSSAARELCALHRAWLMNYWAPAMYTPATHRALAQGYVDDPRFCAYYEAYAPGGAALLRDAIDTWVGSI